MKLSIITINKNNKAGLEKTAASVLCQTFRDFEWILIDGGSTDGSADVIADISKNPEANITYWCSEQDKGIYNAMNKGILRSKGEYCLFLNSGDYLVNEEVLTNVFAIVFNEDVVYGFLKFNWGDHFEIGSSPLEVTLRTLMEGTIHHAGNSFIRRDAFVRWGMYDESLRIVSDWKWFLQAIGLSTATTRYIDVMTSVFDCTGISVMQCEELCRERELVIIDAVPPRILQVYQTMEAMEEYKRQCFMARSSYSYRIGKIVLFPFRLLRGWMNK